jgi:hypothetical protein
VALLYWSSGATQSRPVRHAGLMRSSITHAARSTLPAA